MKHLSPFDRIEGFYEVDECNDCWQISSSDSFNNCRLFVCLRYVYSASSVPISALQSPITSKRL